MRPQTDANIYTQLKQETCNSETGSCNYRTIIDRKHSENKTMHFADLKMFVLKTLWPSIGFFLIITYAYELHKTDHLHKLCSGEILQLSLKAKSLHKNFFLSVNLGQIYKKYIYRQFFGFLNTPHITNSARIFRLFTDRLSRFTL